jgi:peptide/nickel transport system permease protein
MGVYITRRLLWLPVLLLIVSLIVFVMGRIAPGDPVQIMLGARYDPQVAANLREQLGLDRPLLVQYADYMWDAMHGDFGQSLRFRGRPVGQLLGPKMWVSFQVNLAAMIASVGVGLPLGFFIAHKQGRWQDPTTVTIGLALMSIPIMVTIPFALLVMCGWLSLVPCSGWGGIWDARIIVPTITMGLFGFAGLMRLMRASTLDVMGQDFIRTAYAKGLTRFAVDSRHVLKNALIPIVTVLTLSLDGMLTTSFVAERILGIPGMGDFVIESIFNRDYPVIMAVTLIGSTAFVLATLLADVAYTFIDPRIRYS